MTPLRCVLRTDWLAPPMSQVGEFAAAITSSQASTMLYESGVMLVISN